MRVVFMGSPAFALLTLQALIDSPHEIAAAYTQPPRRAGRGKKLRPQPVHAAAEEAGLTVRHPVNFRGAEDRAAFAALDADIAVVAAYGLLLPQEILDAPHYGCINLHPSLLPRWRGAAPLHRPIMAGDSETGVCVMRMEAGLDTGPVLLREATPISLRETAADLHDRLADQGARMILHALDLIAAGAAIETPQSEEGVVYASKIDKAEARLDWTRPAVDLDRLIRGVQPAARPWFDLNGEMIKVLAAEPVPGGAAPGTVIAAPLTVACGGGALRLDRLQRAGAGPVDADAFVRGRPVPIGSVLG